MTPPPGPPDSAFGNDLLATLTRKELAELRPHLMVTELRHRQVLYEPNAVVDRAFFPRDAVVSLLTVLRDGTSVEAAMVGRDGIIGVPLLAHNTLSTARIVVQVPGHALAIETERLRAALPHVPTLVDGLAQYTHAFVAQLLQSAACASIHSAEQRLARWLLAAADRTRNKSLRSTHEYLAEVLGVGRPTVTLAARSLQTASLIEYRRGLIMLRDRGGLEDVACECYRTLRGVYERRLPQASKQTAR